MSYGTDAPAYWDPSLAGDESSSLEQEQCIIKDEHFFVRGRLVIPVTDAVAGTEFDWGVWVSLSRGNFTRALSPWTTPGREREQPYFGWMSTELPLYQPSTLAEDPRPHAGGGPAAPHRARANRSSAGRRTAHRHHTGARAGDR